MVSSIGNKGIFAKNLNYYIERSGKNQREIASDLNIATSTLNNWATAQKYPRIDKIEMLANYFGIQKSDLIEEKLTEEQAVFEASVLLDEDVMDLVHIYMCLSDEQKNAVKQMAKLLAST